MAVGEPNHERDDYEHVLALADLLAANRLPPSLEVPFRLREGEACYYHAQGDVAAFLAAEVPYTSTFAFGTGALGIAAAAATLAGSAISKGKAERAAAEQWRLVAAGAVYLTTARMTVQHEHIWFSTWYDELMVAHREDDAVYLQRESSPAVRVRTPDPNTFFVLLQRLAFDRVIRPPWPVPKPPYDTRQLETWRSDEEKRVRAEADALAAAKLNAKFRAKPGTTVDLGGGW